ncbi:MAG: amphi-Trp domain-containing protein [Nannocystaceae bacterium]|nr:amphi-Trp domain-containing protein [Myxococcales bacterium]
MSSETSEKIERDESDKQARKRRKKARKAAEAAAQVAPAEDAADEPAEAVAAEPEEVAEADEAEEADDAAEEVEAERKKTKIEFKSAMDREEAVAYFAAIVEGLRSGSVTFKRGDRSLELDVPEQLSVEVSAARKGAKTKIEFEITWRGDRPALSIVPGDDEG